MVSEYQRIGGEHGHILLHKEDDTALMQLASGVGFLPQDKGYGNFPDNHIDFQRFEGLNTRQFMSKTYKSDNYLCSKYGIVIFDVNNISKVLNIIKKAPKTTFMYRIYGNFNAKGYENKDSKLTLNDLQTLYERLYSTIDQ